jgi:hypothetical protein
MMDDIAPELGAGDAGQFLLGDLLRGSLLAAEKRCARNNTVGKQKP